MTRIIVHKVQAVIEASKNDFTNSLYCPINDLRISLTYLYADETVIDLLILTLGLIVSFNSYIYVIAKFTKYFFLENITLLKI